MYSIIQREMVNKSLGIHLPFSGAQKLTNNKCLLFYWLLSACTKRFAFPFSLGNKLHLLLLYESVRFLPN